MSRFLFLLPTVLILCQHGCAVFNIQVAPDTLERDVPEVDTTYLRAIKHRVHALPSQGDQLAEIVMQSTGDGRSAISVGMRPGLENEIEMYAQSPLPEHSKFIEQPNAQSATIPRSTPTIAARWLAVEKALWRAAYGQGKVHHESVGNGYTEDSENEMNQHAIRQTIRIRMTTEVECVARRKFYLEEVTKAHRLVDRYVDSFRRRIGLRNHAPFGIDKPRVRDQLYFQHSQTNSGRERIELHRSYLVLNATPGELVETALICQGPDVNASRLGTFETRWTDAARRLAIQFNPQDQPRVQALDHRAKPQKSLENIPVAQH